MAENVIDCFFYFHFLAVVLEEDLWYSLYSIFIVEGDAIL